MQKTVICSSDAFSLKHSLLRLSLQFLFILDTIQFDCVKSLAPIGLRALVLNIPASALAQYTVLLFLFE
jgi:hypothetical protein